MLLVGVVLLPGRLRLPARALLPHAGSRARTATSTCATSSGSSRCACGSPAIGGVDHRRPGLALPAGRVHHPGTAPQGEAVRRRLPRAGLVLFGGGVPVRLPHLPTRACSSCSPSVVTASSTSPTSQSYLSFISLTLLGVRHRLPVPAGAGLPQPRRGAAPRSGCGGMWRGMVVGHRGHVRGPHAEHRPDHLHRDGASRCWSSTASASCSRCCTTGPVGAGSPTSATLSDDEASYVDPEPSQL